MARRLPRRSRVAVGGWEAVKDIIDRLTADQRLALCWLCGLPTRGQPLPEHVRSLIPLGLAYETSEPDHIGAARMSKLDRRSGVITHFYASVIGHDVSERCCAKP